MTNPFTKKNPFMSMWMSGANQVAGKARSAMQAAARRQQTAAGTEAARAITSFWSGFFSSAFTGRRPKTRR